MPVNAAGAWESVVKAYTGDHSVWILSNPGFLAEGTAMKELSNPDRVFFGGHTTCRRSCGRGACRRLCHEERRQVCCRGACRHLRQLGAANGFC